MRETTLQGSKRHAELPGGFVLRPPLKVARDYRGAFRSGKSTQLLVQEGADFFRVPRGGRRKLATDGSHVFARAAPGVGAPKLSRQAERSLVQPVAQRRPPGNQPGLSREHEECCLERVLGVRTVAQLTAANAEDEAPVTMDQLCESGLVTAADEALDQLSIRVSSRARRAGQAVDVSKHVADGRTSHEHLPMISSW
jgi:hypothetical protein